MTVYSTIVADPPWPSMHQRSTYHRGKPERHYQTMTVEQIAALPVPDLAAEDAHLWIWGVNRLLGAAYDVARAWGFTPMSLLTWCKPGPGMGYYLRSNTEHAVFATRGRPMVPQEKLPGSWFQWRRRRHSEKPDEFFALVEQISPSPRLELFARRARPGWAHWGDQAPDPIAWADIPPAAAGLRPDGVALGEQRIGEFLRKLNARYRAPDEHEDAWHDWLDLQPEYDAAATADEEPGVLVLVDGTRLFPRARRHGGGWYAGRHAAAAAAVVQPAGEAIACGPDEIREDPRDGEAAS